MQKATFKDLGIKFTYWLIPIGFGAAGITALIFSSDPSEDRTTLLVCGGFFALVAILATLWPILRMRESQAVLYTRLRSGRDLCEGILIPVSKVKIRLALIGSAVFGAAALGAVVFADTLEYRVKGGIAFIFYAGFFLLWFRSCLKQIQGIHLTQEGLIWHEALRSPYLIPWDEITSAKAFLRKEHYVTVPAFGLLVRNLENVRTTPRSRKRLLESISRNGWHLYYLAESLLVPLSTVERAIHFYWQHPETRGELATGAALDRVAKFDAVNPSDPEVSVHAF